MKRSIFRIVVVSFAISFSLISCQTGTRSESNKEKDIDTISQKEETHKHGAGWSYEGETAPEYWHQISEEYKDCAGNKQMPVDIVSAQKSEELKPLVLEYVESEVIPFVNNGHSVQVDYQGGNFILGEDKVDYKIKQFHFHCPSENTVEGEAFPMEIHFVHMNENGEFAVIGLFVKEGKENQFFKKYLSDIPQKSGDKIEIKESLNINTLLPKDKGYWHLHGSLTTPPCSEGVKWYVFRTPVEASKEQLEAFRNAMPKNNARPVQPLNGREIFEF